MTEPREACDVPFCQRESDGIGDLPLCAECRELLQTHSYLQVMRMAEERAG